MFCGNFFIIVGAVLAANAHDRPMFIGGRYLTGQFIFPYIIVLTYITSLSGIGSCDCSFQLVSIHT